MRGPVLIDAKDIVVQYGDTEAVKGISLMVNQGDVVGLIGPDGAGKTSTLRVLAGLLCPSGGAVTVLGKNAWIHRRSLHLRLGYLPQRFALYDDLTVDENMQFFALLLGVREWKSRRDVLLTRVGLIRFRGRQADRLSGGMRQKLSLAVSLMHAPDILLLDESTTGVDPVTRREFWDLLATLVTEGLTLVLATPYLDEAERCSHVILMHSGSILAEGSPKQLVSLVPGAMFELEAEPRARVMEIMTSMPEVEDVQPFAARFHVRLIDSVDAEARVRKTLNAAGITMTAWRPTTVRLEDTFLHLTRAAKLHQGGVVT